MTVLSSLRSLLKPEGTDAVSELRIAIGANADLLDAAMTVTQGTFASRPTSGMKTNDAYWSTDIKRLDRWNGGGWDIVIDQRFLPPIGALQDYVGSADPATGGWMVCNGRSMSRSSFASLFAVVGTTFGAADGSSFNLPDLRGRTTVGAGTGAGLTARTLGANLGEEAHSLSGAEVGPHTHSGTTGGENHSLDHTHFTPFFTPGRPLAAPFSGTTRMTATGGAATPPTIVGDWTEWNETAGVSSGLAAHNHPFTTNNGDGVIATPHQNMQPSTVLNKIIRVL